MGRFFVVCAVKGFYGKKYVVINFLLLLPQAFLAFYFLPSQFNVNFLDGPSRHGSLYFWQAAIGMMVLGLIGLSSLNVRWPLKKSAFMALILLNSACVFFCLLAMIIPYR